MAGRFFAKFGPPLYKFPGRGYNRTRFDTFPWFLKGSAYETQKAGTGTAGIPAGDALVPSHRRPGIDLRPGPGTGGGGMGQLPCGVPHEIRQADHPGESAYLFQPDFCGPGGLSAAGGRLEGHHLPVHRGGQCRHRHRAADPLQADHRQALPALRLQGAHRAGRNGDGAAHRPTGAGGHRGTHRRVPDPR